MTLGFYTDFQELFQNCCLHFTGVAETNLGFPILPTGVTVTPSGTFNKDDFGNTKLIVHQTTDNYITLTDSVDYYFGSGSFSIAFWLSVSTGSLTGTVGIMGQVPTDGSTPNTGFVIILQDGVPRFYWYNGTTPTGYSSTYGALTGSTYTPSLSITWYYLAFVGDGSNLKIYVNCVQYGSVACTNIADSSLLFHLGGSQISSWPDIAGNLVHVMMFKGRALSLSELTTIMRLTHPTTGPGLLPLYQGVRGIE